MFCNVCRQASSDPVCKSCRENPPVNVSGYEYVNHPKHYNKHPSGVECIDIIEHFSFPIGTVIKYLWRAGLKPGDSTLQDLKKAAWYLTREIERLEKAK